MERKFLPGTAGLILFILFTLGCSGLQKDAVIKQYFDLKPDVRLSVKSNPKQGETLMVKAFSINSTFDSHSFVYKVGENEYTTDYYSEFVNYPSKLITERISETLYGTPHFRPALTDDKKDIAYRLSGKINKLAGDFTDKNDRTATIELVLTLEKRTGSTFTPVLSNTYAADEPIPDKAPASLVSGWNTGLSAILNQFIVEFQNL